MNLMLPQYFHNILVAFNDKLNNCLTMIAGNRLRNFRVGVTNRHPRRVRPNHSNYHLCRHHGGAVGRGQLLNLNCRRGLYGRYVIVQIHGRQYLTLCEVDVFGE